MLPRVFHSRMVEGKMNYSTVEISWSVPVLSRLLVAGRSGQGHPLRDGPPQAGAVHGKAWADRSALVPRRAACYSSPPKGLAQPVPLPVPLRTPARPAVWYCSLFLSGYLDMAPTRGGINELKYAGVSSWSSYSTESICVAFVLS